MAFLITIDIIIILVYNVKNVVWDRRSTDEGTDTVENGNSYSAEQAEGKNI